MTQRAHLRRLATLAVALTVGMSLLVGPAGATEPTAQETRQSIIGHINSLIPTGSEDADKKLAEATKKLTESLSGKYWSGPNELSDEGEKVFDKDRDAVKKLRDALKQLEGPQHEAVVRVISAIVEADTQLALAMISAAQDAQASTDKIEDAWKEMGKAEEELADDKPHDAIEKLKKAWEKAFKAEADASKAAATGGDGGDYAAYTFWFVEYQLPGATPFAATGSNRAGTEGYTGQGNEGFLRVRDEFMQLHVSCSDAFTDGTGDKSDPTEASKYRVVTARIAKYKDGVIDKECDINGGMAEFGSVVLEKAFAIDGGEWYDGDYDQQSVDANGHNVSYRFTVTNAGNVDLANFRLSDPGYDVGSCFEGLTLASGGSDSCVIGPYPVEEGLNYNEATVTADYVGGTASDTDVAQFTGYIVQG